MIPSKRRTSKRVTVPPAVLAGFRILAFAAVKRPIVYSGRSGLMVGTIDGDAREIGPVPRLAIGQSLRGRREFALLHCTRTWNVLGVEGSDRTVAEVKRRAERTYPGVSDFWEPTNVTVREAKKFERDSWQALQCDFCGRIPPEQETMALASVISSRTATICAQCITDFYEMTTGDPDEGGPNSL